MESFQLLDSSWTVLSETAHFAQVHLGNLDERAVSDNEDGEQDACFKIVSK